MGIDEIYEKWLENEKLKEGIKDILGSFIAWNFPSLAPPDAKPLDWDGATKAMMELFKQHSKDE